MRTVSGLHQGLGGIGGMRGGAGVTVEFKGRRRCASAKTQSEAGRGPNKKGVLNSNTHSVKWDCLV